MKIAFVVFDNITWLDFFGIYDSITRLKSSNYIHDLSWDICSYKDKVHDIFGLQVMAPTIYPSLDSYDALIIPGGQGTRTLIHEEKFIGWIKTAAPVKYKISVCTGSLILGAAGFLAGKKATTHFNEYETLKLYCKEVVAERIVEDGDVITAGAVSSSLDLGLYLCKKWAGQEVANDIRRRMNYMG